MHKEHAEKDWSPYKDKAFKRTVYLLLFLIVMILLSILVSLGSGHLTLTLPDIIRTVRGQGTDAHRLLLYQFRLPRTLL
ncbi:MAG: hypothetical protein JJU01_05340, partial [Alkalibacterium sp.]|nr:hypothetical protein [Alkalibacterium sp.]